MNKVWQSMSMRRSRCSRTLERGRWVSRRHRHASVRRKMLMRWLRRMLGVVWLHRHRRRIPSGVHILLLVRRIRLLKIMLREEILRLRQNSRNNRAMACPYVDAFEAASEAARAAHCEDVALSEDLISQQVALHFAHLALTDHLHFVGKTEENTEGHH